MIFIKMTEEKNMKKLLAIILSAVILFSLAACSAKEDETGTDAVKETTAETTAPADEETTQATSEPVSEPEDEPSDEFNFTGVTVADNNYCQIKITEIKDALFGTALTVEAVNKTTDMNLCFTTESCSVNGVAVDALLAETVQAGKSVSADVTIFDEVLKEIGITKYTDIEITFRVYDSDYQLDDDVALETVRIYPYGEGSREKYTREEKDTDISIFDTDKVSATVIGYGNGDYGDYAVELYLENKSADKDYTFYVSNSAINSLEVMSLGTVTVPAGKVAFETVYISDPSIEKSGITDVTDVYLVLDVSEADSWDSEDIANNSIHIYPNGQENATAYVREVKDTDTVLVDNENVTIIITGMESDETFGSESLGFCLVNKTNESVTFLMDNVSVNGVMMDPFFIVSLAPGLTKLDTADWYSDELSENGIEEIEKIEFTFTASSSDDYTKDDYFNDNVIYNP